MKTLLKCREELDEIDNQIIQLFEKRMDVIKDVTTYKNANNLPIYDEKREKVMLENNVKKCKNTQYQKYYKTVLIGFLTASKELQKDLLDKKWHKKSTNKVCCLIGRFFWLTLIN